MTFRNQFSEDIFNYKYRHDGCETWADLAETLVLDVCSQYLPKEEIDQLTKYISDMKFIPGGGICIMQVVPTNIITTVIC